MRTQKLSELYETRIDLADVSWDALAEHTNDSQGVTLALYYSDPYFMVMYSMGEDLDYAFIKANINFAPYINDMLESLIGENSRALFNKEYIMKGIKLGMELTYYTFKDNENMEVHNKSIIPRRKE